MHILLVDDDRASLRLSERRLQRLGHEVLTASDGHEALDLLDAHPALNVVITDWAMPGMDGPTLCRSARALERTGYLYIIMLTHRDTKTDLVQSLEDGADIFLSKPVETAELAGYLQVIGRLNGLEQRLALKIEELDNAHRALQQEIEAAGRIQRSLLPSVSPVVPYLDTAWLFQSCNVTAGDMLNVVRLDEHHLGLYVLDVSGHGCQAAMLSVSLSRVLNPYPQQGGILKRFTTDTRGYRIPGPAEVAGELNRRFPVMRQSGQFFTFIYGILHIHTLELVYTRAGHPRPMLYAAGRMCPLEDASSVPLGIMETAAYQDHRVTLAPGDLLLFFTDGFEEAKDQEGHEFGRERMEAIIAARPSWQAEEAVAALQEGLAAFAHNMVQADDMTMVGLSVHPDHPAGKGAAPA